MADNRRFNSPLPLAQGQGRQEVAASGGNVGSHPMIDISTGALNKLQGQLDSLTETLVAEEDFAQTQTALHNMRVLKDEKEAELFDRLNLPDGDDNSFYDNGGKLRTGKLKDFINSYATPMRQLGAAGLTPRSREMVAAQAMADVDEFSRAVMMAGRERGRKRAMDAADARLKYHRLRGDYKGANAVVADMYEAGLASVDDMALLEEQNRLAAEQKAQADRWKGAQELMYRGDMAGLSAAFHNGDFDILPVAQRASIREYLNNSTTEGREVSARDAQGRVQKSVEPPLGLPTPVVNAWMLANSGEVLTQEQQTEVQQALEYYANYTITTPDDVGQQELVRQMGKKLKLSDKYVEAVIKGSVSAFGSDATFEPNAYVDSVMGENGAILTDGVTRTQFDADNARMHELRQMKADNGGSFKSTQLKEKAELERLEYIHEFRMRKQRELVARQKAKGMQRLRSLLIGNPDASYVEQQEAFLAGFSEGLTEAQMEAGSAYARMKGQMELDSAQVTQRRADEEAIRQGNANDATGNAAATDKARTEPQQVGTVQELPLGATRDAMAIEGSDAEMVLYVPKAEGGMKDGQTIKVYGGSKRKPLAAQVKVKVQKGISAPVLSARALRALGALGESTGRLLYYGNEAYFVPGEHAPGMVEPTTDDGLVPQGSLFPDTGEGEDPLANHDEELPL